VAWGENTYGDLGTGSVHKKSSPIPVAVVNLSGVTAIAAGDHHNLALLGNGTVKAWGLNNHGQLGDGRDNGQSDVPVMVTGLREAVTSISAGGNHSLAQLHDGTVMAWGSHQGGQLGNGLTRDSDVPVLVCGMNATAPCSPGDGNILTGVVAISAGAHHNLALLSNGQVTVWGSNEWGALGTGNANDPNSDVPVVLTGLGGVTAISAGGFHSLVMTS